MSVKDALGALRPALVTDADKVGVPVVRQGDIFAIPAPLTTRDMIRKARTAPPRSRPARYWANGTISEADSPRPREG